MGLIVMSVHCCPAPAQAAVDPRYRRVLWIALCINAAMFMVEIVGSFAAGSAALLADAVDFFGDAANYGLSLAVLSMGLAWRARAALVKGISMGVFGVAILAKAAWTATSGTVPDAMTMGAIGIVALTANLTVATMLYRWRNGDANMRSVWLCTRNDVLGNIAVIIAALGVFGSHTAWPDLIVAVIMALLALTAATSVIRQARRELELAAVTHAPHAPHAPHAH